MALPPTYLSPTYRPEIDGLRALAVSAVMAFHFGLIDGGYLGVDLFFVISGYLITSSLTTGLSSAGTFSLPEFWMRRARRLLPALFVTTIAVVFVARSGWGAQDFSSLKRDALSGLGFVSNWAQIGADVDYWDRFRAPSMLRHLWSLAVEEQFYVIWPPVLIAVLRRFGRVWALRTALALMALSAVWAVVVSRGGEGMTLETTTRAYFGTDTRAAALLAGAALALWASGRTTGRSGGDGTGRWVEIVSAAALVTLVGSWLVLPENSPFLWSGGLALCGALATAVVAGLVTDNAPGLANALSFAPLVAMGRVSYGLYLWHWPVTVVTEDVSWLSDGARLGVRAVATSVLAAASYRWIERPILEGASRGQSKRFGEAAMLGVGAIVTTVLVVSTLKAPVLSATTVDVLSATKDESSPLLAAGTKPRVLVMGDSLALDVGVGMETLGNRHGFEVLNLGVGACPLALDHGSTQTQPGKWLPDPKKCRELLNRFDAAVSEFDPNLVFFIFGRTSDTQRKFPDGTLASPCEPRYDEWRASTWRQVLEHAGAAVPNIAVTNAPYGRGIWAKPTGDTETDCLNRSTEAAVADHPEVRLIDLKSWVCPSSTCIDMMGSAPLRWDGLHFGETTSPVAAMWLLDHAAEGWK